ncbi:MAG: hypothetical protein QW717_00870 [Candidatus Bathyarchaeia archaeon]
MQLLDRFNFAKINGLLACFCLGFLVRLIPEVLAYPCPVGFDTVDYAFTVKSGVVWPHWSCFFTYSWLFPAFSTLLYNVFGGDAFMLLKVLAPLLFGLNAAGVFWFADKMLGWTKQLSLLAGVFFAFQLASLRISWDLFRNTLGMAIMLFALPFIKTVNTKRGFTCLTVLSLLTVFAHEFTAACLLFTVAGFALMAMVEKKGLVNVGRLLLAVLPALAVFALSVYLRLHPLRYEVETNVAAAGDVVEANVGGAFFLVDYLSVKTSVDLYGSYIELLWSVAALFCLLYLPIIYLVWKGFFKEPTLNFWTLLLTVGAFGCLVSPFCALLYWHRWMFMLVYPFTFYAVNGFQKCLHGDGLRLPGRKALGMVLASAFVGCAYLATPLLMNTVNVGVFSLNPVNRYISFAPTVPYEDVENVKQAMVWLDMNMDGESCVLLQHALFSWGRLYLGGEHFLVHFETDVDLAVETAYRHGYSRIFFVWWNKPIGWYGVTVPESFRRHVDFGRISVYTYV